MNPTAGTTSPQHRAPTLAVVLVLLLAVVVPVQLTLVTSLAVPTVTVNSTGDDPDANPGDEVCDTGQDLAGGVAECTLRATTVEANASLAITQIAFIVPTADPDGIVTIAPDAALPTLTAPVTIDGSDQPGFDGDPIVAIDGSAWASTLLDVDGGDTTIRSLVLHSAGNEAIDLAGAGGNTVQGNWIGLLPDGSTAAGSAADDGIAIRASAPGNTIGGSAAGEGNVIAAAGGDGLYVLSDGNSIIGNRIGTSADGSLALGSGRDGVRIEGATGTLVSGNTIAHNGGAGVTVVGGGDDAAVVGNSITANAGLGIDHGADGVPNGLPNMPVPTAASDEQVAFDLDVPLGEYRVEVFRNPTEGADPSGHGEGEELVGAATVNHLGTGPASFTVDGLTGTQPGDVLSLTATEDLGGGSYGATSEFSATITAIDHVMTVNHSGDAADASPGDGTCGTGGPDVGGVAACTLRAALQEANATAVIDTIEFAVPAGDPGNTGGIVTIEPVTTLPSIAAAVTVDGSTQPGFTADPIIGIDGGTLAGSNLEIAAADSTVRSLALYGGGSHGITVTAADVTIADTWVGLRPDGTEAGPTGDGVRVDGAARVLITGSRIADSTGNGVTVLGAAADDVAVVGTTVRDSGGLGIDLGGDGVTANDVGDADTGPNGLHNHPVVTSLTAAAGTVTLDLQLDAPAGDVLLQVFTTPAPDPSGHGEGDTLVHSATVNHPGGSATHTVSFAADATATFTATATDDLGGGVYGATSEFSATATAPVAADDPGDVATTVTAASPLSYWRLGAIGTTAFDESSLANHGTTNGGPTRGAAGALTGDADGATGFDGTDDVVTAAHDPAYLLDQGAVSLWVNLDDLTAARVPFSKESAGLDTGGHTELRIQPDGTVVHRLATTTGEVEVASAAGAVTSGAWHHLATTFGPRGMELWVDGVRVDADPHDGGWGTTSGGSGNAEPITIGASGAISGDLVATPASDWFAGRIDEVAVFGTQLDGATIAALAGAAGQHYQVDSGAGLAVPATTGVLANDHDADGDALTVTLATGPSSAASFNLQPDGSFTYTSVAGFTGTDSFTYTVSDGVASPATATATITVLPARGDRVIDDATGNGHDGTPSGGMTSGDAAAGKIGRALDFDGVDDRVEINNLDVAGSALTLSAWVDPDTIGDDPTVLAKAVGLADADVEWRVLLADTSVTTANAVASVRTTGGLATAIDAGTTGTADGWVHLVARYDGSQVVLFRDGVAVQTAAHSGTLRPDPSVATWIGDAPNGGRAFDGRIDEVRVSHTARSDVWIAATHATQDQPGAAVTVGATETSASPGWTTDSSQARSGSSAALAPSGVLRSWLTLDGVDEGGLEAVAWWRVGSLTGLDIGQGVRAGDAAGSDPVQQDETGLFGAAGWDLGEVDGSRTQLVPPPAGQSPAVDTWQRVELRIDQAGALSATAAGTDVPTSGTTPAGVTPTGTVGFRVGPLDPTTQWWIDDLRIRRYVTPEPVATLRRTELAP